MTERKPSADERAYLESLVSRDVILADKDVYVSTVAAGWVEVNHHDRPWDPRRALLTEKGVAMLSRTDDVQPTWHVLRWQTIAAMNKALRSLGELESWAMSDWREGTDPEGGAQAFAAVRIQSAACKALLEKTHRDIWEAGR